MLNVEYLKAVYCNLQKYNNSEQVTEKFYRKGALKNLRKFQQKSFLVSLQANFQTANFGRNCNVLFIFWIYFMDGK